MPSHIMTDRHNRGSAIRCLGAISWSLDSLIERGAHLVLAEAISYLHLEAEMTAAVAGGVVFHTVILGKELRSSLI